MDEQSNPRRLYGASALAFGGGAIIGGAAGLLGVGGGEFRIPILAHLLRHRPRSLAAVNLIVGTFTVVIGLVRRWDYRMWNVGTAFLASTLVVASLAGAVFGARRASRLPIHSFRRAIEIYLIVVGGWMIFEAFTHSERVVLHLSGTSQLLLIFVIGVTVAFASSAVGVAGGELRIPALLYLCAIPLKAAGTLSLLASLPTVVAGAVTYASTGALPREAVRIALYMAFGSLLGVLYGAYFLPQVGGHALKGILGGVLIAAAAGLIAQERGEACRE